jgi:hypothetical protein
LPAAAVAEAVTPLIFAGSVSLRRQSQGTLNLAPMFKPACGIFSDNVALCGSFRRNYFM